MKIPAMLKKAVALAEQKRAQKEETIRREDEKEKARLAAIDKERESRSKELEEYAKFIVDWIRKFLATEECKKIVKLFGPGYKICLFVDKFWRGEPVPKSYITVCAKLSVQLYISKHLFVLVYEEMHKGRSSFRQELYSPADLAAKTHPEFVSRVYKHLQRGNVWENISASIMDASIL